MEIITIIDKKNNVYKLIYNKTDRNVYDLLDGLKCSFRYEKNINKYDYRDMSISFATTFIIN